MVVVEQEMRTCRKWEGGGSGGGTDDCVGGWRWETVGRRCQDVGG